jgi:hypothetical protein
MNRSFFLCVLLLAFSLTAVANIAPVNTPKKVTKRSIDTQMMIHLDHDAKEARLVIPKSQVQQLRAQLDQLDGGQDTAAAVSTGGISKAQTIVSGMFLSLALVFGGMWFVRSGGSATKSGKALVILAILACAGSTATFVFANAGPPPEARSITGKMFTQAVHLYGFGSGHIKLEVANEDRQYIDLIVPDPKPATSGDEE